MEDTYFFHRDIVFELSSLYQPESLIDISLTHRIYKLFIFELKHCEQRFYYHNIDKFPGLQSIHIPKFHDMNNFNSKLLSNITSLIFYNYRQKERITLFTNLIDCKLKQIYQRESLICQRRSYHLNIQTNRDISLVSHFSNVTSLNIVNRCRTEICNLSRLSMYPNVKSLSISLIPDICGLSRLTALNILTLRNFETIEGNNILFLKNINPTHLAIHCDEKLSNICVLNNCSKLKSLQLSGCYSLIMNHVSNIRTLIIRESDDVSMKMSFDVNECLNLRYLSFGCGYKLTRCLSLSNLSKLEYLCLNNIELDDNFYNIENYENNFCLLSITRLELERSTRVINLLSFPNLKYLQMRSGKGIHLNKLTQLVNLRLFLSLSSEIINLNFHRNLTHLHLWGNNMTHLSKVTNLKYLCYSKAYSKQSNGSNTIDICNQLNHLTTLTLLRLNFEKTREDIFFDINLLSNCVNLKSLETDMKLNSLSSLIKLNSLTLETAFCNHYNDSLSLLTRLTHVGVYIGSDDRMVDLRNLTRLEQINAKITYSRNNDLKRDLRLPLNYEK